MAKTALLTLILLFSACKTTAPSVADGPQRQMLGLGDEPLAADWLEWTPQQQTSTPTSLADDATAFDYWQITDEAKREEAWAAIFGLLGEVRRVAPREYDTTFRMLMTVLEPGTDEGAQHLDATFFAARPGTSSMFEGVGWRLWRELPSGATPGVTVWLRRYEASAERPTEAFVWFYGGFDEAKSLTLRFDGTNGWAMTVGDGIITTPSTAMKGESRLLEGIIVGTFWQPIIGSQYLETDVERRERTTPTPAQQPTALGLPLGDRDIDQVFSDSVFAPRLTLFPAKQQ